MWLSRSETRDQQSSTDEFEERSVPVRWEIVTAAPEVATASATLLLAGTAVWALRFAKRQLKQDRNAARIDNLERQMEFFDSERFVSIRKRLASSRTKNGKLQPLSDDDAPSELYDVLNFFEHLGFLVREKHLPAYHVWHAFGYWAFSFFYDARRVIEYEQANDPTFFDDFEWLIGKLQRIETKQCGRKDIPSDDELLGFYLEENRGTTVRQRKARRRPGKKETEVPSPETSVGSKIGP